MSKPFSVYIHIPFCFQKCPYCDFNTYAVSKIPDREYVDALKAEIDYYANLPEWKNRPIQTIYFGGGTPSIFSPQNIKQVISTLTDNFPTLPFVELTLEANPIGISTDHLLLWSQSGINRLSLGSQSFQPHVLNTLGRTHSPEHIHSAVISAKECGFKNISLDLIVGVPGQSLVDLNSDLENCLDLEVPHVSVYALTIEKGTPFYQSVKKGLLKTLEEDLTLKMLEITERNLGLDGLIRYEISNFAKTGYESRHNLAYWNQDDYLGLGAGAHSYLKIDSENSKILGKRWSNFALPEKYIQETTTNGKSVSWSEELNLKSAIFEYFMLGLRKTAGISIVEFEKKFNTKIESCYGDLLEILSNENLIRVEGDFICLSSTGINLSDSVIANFAEPILK